MPKPIEDMDDDDLDKIVSQMNLTQLKTFEKKVRKAGTKKKRLTRKKEKAQDAFAALIAEGLS